MSIIDTLQAKINNADSDTSMSDILALLHAAKEYPINSVYDSAGLMPTTDSADIGRIAFAENNDAMYVLVGLDSGWQLIDSDAASPSVTPYFGYAMGGYNPGSTRTSNIEKFNMTSETNGTSVGDLAAAYTNSSGGRSSTHGYNSGGNNPAGSGPDWISSRTNQIQKFPFASDDDATDVGDMLEYGGAANRNPSSSSTHSYLVGGYMTPTNSRTDVIQKFAHATDGNSTDVGNLLVDQFDYGENVHSSDHGYTLGGFDYNPPPTTQLNQISKYAFATDGNATDVGDLTTTAIQTRAFQSSTNGYKAGGSGGAPMGGDTIESFPFSSDTNSSDTGDNAISAVIFQTTGHNTDTAGFFVGGRNPADPSTPYNHSDIEKYLFAGGANMTDVADLNAGRSYHAGVNQN